MKILRPRGHGIETVPKLAELCGARHERVDRHTQRHDDGIIIPWGARSYGAAVNRRTGMMLNSSKGACRVKLFMDGVCVPKPVWPTFGNIKYPVIARPQHHCQGRDLHMIHDDEALLEFYIKHPDYYLAELFVKDKEFRVHCAHGKVLLVQEKPLVEGVTQANRHITNESWRVVPWSECDEYGEVLRQALSAVDSIGLDFGGVDVMLDSTTGQVAVCEINTAPSLGVLGTEKYARYFNWLNDNDTPCHWPWKTYQKVRSLFWKKINWTSTPSKTDEDGAQCDSEG